MTDELKPVPCGCGGEAKVFAFRKYYICICQKCEVSTGLMDTKTDAIIAWNKAMSGHTQWSILADVRPEGVYCKGCGYRMDCDE